MTYSNTPSSMPLKFVDDVFTPEQHQEMDILMLLDDQEVAKLTAIGTDKYPEHTTNIRNVHDVYLESSKHDEELKKKLNMEQTGRELAFNWVKGLSTEDRAELEGLLAQAWTNKAFKQIRLLKCFWKEELPHGGLSPNDHNQEGQWKATVESWNETFKGNAHQALWDHMKKNWNPQDAKTYAHYISIVQSSGMGKSRLTDELSKEHFVIPICLRPIESTGFPPSDPLARSILIHNFNGPEDGRQHCDRFLSALFDAATQVVKDVKERKNTDDYTSIASEFRTLMTGKQSHATHGPGRRNFYQQVHELYNQSPPAKPNESLERLVKELGYDDSSTTGPLVIITFDEAHEMSLVKEWDVDGKAKRWSNFGELRRALQELKALPLFCLFLSTTSKFTQFGSSTEDISSRVTQGSITLIKPFTDLGFDYFVPPLLKTMTIHDFTREEFMVTFGRPLFATRWLHGNQYVRQDIVQFAASKLLNERNLHDLSNIFSKAQHLAVLSQRLPIEFKMANYLDQAEMTQVERHMRVCLEIHPALTSMRSVSASEPLLSEAAFRIMQNQKEEFNAPKALLDVVNGFSVDQGDKGELVAMLLVTLARDAAVCEQNGEQANNFSSTDDDLNRSVPVIAFIKNLFHYDGLLFQRKSPRNKATTVFGNLGHGYEDIKVAFETDFKDAVFSFSHFIRAHDHASLNRQHLSRCIIRGAAFIGNASHKGVDFIIPFLMKDGPYHEWKQSYILIQVKNDSRYSVCKDEHFDKMGDPYSLGILDQQIDAPYPFIRIFFSLAAKTPALRLRRTLFRDQRKDHGKLPQYVSSYDFWCGSLSATLSPMIKPNDENLWQALVSASQVWEGLFKENGSWIKERMRQNPCASNRLEFNEWCRFGGEAVRSANDEDEDSADADLSDNITSYDGPIDVDDSGLSEALRAKASIE